MQALMQTPQDFASAVPEEGPEWLLALRRTALERFADAGLPGPKDPDHRSSDISQFTREMRPAEPADAPGMHLPTLDGMAARVVLVDGAFRSELSDLGGTDAEGGRDGLEILSLREACLDDREEARVHLDATRPDRRTDPFAELNTALWRDGVIINVLPGVHVDAPVHVLHVRTDARGLCLPRTLVHAQDGASVQVVEQSLGASGAQAPTWALTELHSHSGARITHVDLQEQGPDARLMHIVRSVSERDARVEQQTLHIGGAHARTTLDATLRGQGAEADLHGLTLAADHQRTDCFTRVDHATPNGTSRQLYKAVLDDNARTGFTGNIMVRPGADGTSSEQENRNLLLSRGALADSTPQLEIHAEDVQCSHGSTVGQIDEDQLFFLRSRGIGSEAATAMLTQAFAGEVVEAIRIDAVRQHVTARIEEWFHREAA